VSLKLTQLHKKSNTNVDAILDLNNDIHTMLLMLTHCKRSNFKGLLGEVFFGCCFRGKSLKTCSAL
jgi:hypothetical protein